MSNKLVFKNLVLRGFNITVILVLNFIEEMMQGLKKSNKKKYYSSKWTHLGPRNANLGFRVRNVAFISCGEFRFLYCISIYLSLFRLRQASQNGDLQQPLALTVLHLHK